MPQSNALMKLEQSSKEFGIRIFNWPLRLTWVGITAFTVVAEMVPVPLMAPLPFYCFLAAKLICFGVLGYLAPLAFWRFNALNWGILLATLSASGVELTQAALRHGHSFHWYELIVKLALILLGFALALEARYEQEISIGTMKIRLISDHRDSPRA